MPEFLIEINNLEHGIIKEVPFLVHEMKDKFREQLYRYNEINSFQAAFLKLMEERWIDKIYPLIVPYVINEFNIYYGEAMENREVYFQGLVLPEPESDEWEINFEDETVDPIVHVYMKGWEFKTCALTG